MGPCIGLISSDYSQLAFPGAWNDPASASQVAAEWKPSTSFTKSVHHLSNPAACHAETDRDGLSATLCSETTHRVETFEPVAKHNAAIRLSGARRCPDRARPFPQPRTRGMLSDKQSNLLLIHRLALSKCSMDQVRALASVFNILALYFHGRDQTTCQSFGLRISMGISWKP